MDQAFWYMIDNGIANTKTYPNKFTTSTKCNYTKSMKTASFSKCAHIPSGDYLRLLSAVIQQPTSIAIDAKPLQHYSSGIYTGDCSSTSVNQAMLIVGYGVENNVTFWKIKNSLGVSWGEDGYLLLEREEKDGPGKCGVQLLASVPQGMA
jgi:C1A family cysteine protease